MAESAELFTEQELTCSICLDLFTDPVSTPCGHNFCQVSPTCRCEQRGRCAWDWKLLLKVHRAENNQKT